MSNIDNVGVRKLVAYILFTAIKESQSNNKKIKEDAINFLVSNDCEEYCQLLNFDYNHISNIDFDNLSETVNLDITKLTPEQYVKKTNRI